MLTNYRLLTGYVINCSVLCHSVLFTSVLWITSFSVNSEKFSQLVNCTLDNGITSLVGIRLVAILTMALHLLADIFQLHFESSGWGK